MAKTATPTPQDDSPDSNTQALALVVVIAGFMLVALFLGIALSGNPQDPWTPEDNQTVQEQENDAEVPIEPEPAEVEGYLRYSEDALAESLAKNGKALLFFHAAWCPTSRSAERDILSRSAFLPGSVDIIKVNYDTELELRAKYGIFLQHTFVVIDSEMNELAKWFGGELDEINRRLSKV